MKLRTAVDHFIADARVRLAKQTVTGYESDLNLLVSLASVHAADSVLAFTPALVNVYFQTLSAKNLKQSTLHRRRATLSEFAKWGLRQRLWVTDPMFDAPKIKRPKHLPRPYSRADRKRLMDLELPLEERLIRGLLYYTGCRVSEICGIRVREIESDQDGRIRQIRITGKGSKERVTYVTPELAALLEEYMLSRPALPAGSFLLVQGNGRPFERRMINRRLRVWGKRTGVDRVIPHRFRHTVGTQLVERGADIRKIQKVLGHADIKTTALYAEVADREVEETAMLMSDEGQRERQATETPPGASSWRDGASTGCAS